MFAWARNFLNRHKRKLITVGLVTGGIYAAGKLVKWKLAEVQARQAQEYVEQARKQFHYDSNQRTCVATYMRFLVILRDKVFESLNTEELIALISSKPENKLELWEELKIFSFTKAVAAIVSSCTLYAFLKVQMNIIAGYMFVENSESSEGSKYADLAAVARDIEMDSPISTIEKEYLNNIKVFFEDGIYLMIEDIEKIVKENIGSMKLQSKLSHYDLSKIVVNIWEQFKSKLVNATADEVSGLSTGCAKYLLNIAECRKGTVYLDEVKYQKVMSETLDIVESEDFKTVLTDCIQKNLEQMMFCMEECFQSDQITSLSSEDENEPLEQLSIPLAKLIPILNAQMNQIFKAGQNEYLNNLFSNESINTFSANIYESFSQDVE